MNRTLLVLLVLGVVSGAPVAQSSQPSTVTSASQSLAQENATEYPPGVSAAGVTDPLALADAHRSALANASYTLSASVTYRRPNGSLVFSSVTATRVAPGASSFSALVARTQSNATRPLGVGSSRIAVWGNETRAVLVERGGDGDPTYQQFARERAPFEPTTQWELLYGAFAASNTTVVERSEADGTTLFRIVSTGRPGPESAYPTRSRHGFAAVVDSQGVVRTFQQTYRTTFDDRPAVVSRTVRVTRLGNTTVERPEWYDQAVANGSDEG